MNRRISTVVMAVTLLTLTSGCSGMRNFLFGRGAQCGACNAPTPQTPQPSPCQPAPAPCNQGCTTTPGTTYASQAPCSNCGTYGSAYVGSGCGCNVNDPYMNSGAVVGSPMPYDGQVIDYSESVGAPVAIPGSDGFGPRPATQ